MKEQRNKEKKQEKPAKEGLPIPAGTEQETGLTRGQTEKIPDPVKKQEEGNTRKP